MRTFMIRVRGINKTLYIQAPDMTTARQMAEAQYGKINSISEASNLDANNPWGTGTNFR